MIGQSPQQIKSLLANHPERLEQKIKEGLDLNQRYQGLTLLDIAMLSNHTASIEVLHKYGAQKGLTTEQLAQLKQQVQSSVKAQHTFELQVKMDDFGQPSIIVREFDGDHHLANPAQVIHYQRFSKPGRITSNLSIGKVNGKSCLILSNPDKGNVSASAFHLDSVGNLEIQSIFDESASFKITTDRSVTIEGVAKAHSLNLSAKMLDIKQSSKVQLNIFDAKIDGDMHQNGSVFSNEMNAKADSFELSGETQVSNKATCTAKGRCIIAGNFIAMHNAAFKANSLEIKPETTVMVQEGKLNLYGKAALRNSGAIIADYVTLDSDIMVNNHYGALVKAVTCIVPAKTNQFNNAGYYLVGKKSSLTSVDRALSVAQVGVEVAGIFSLIPTQPLQQLRAGLLLSKTIYHGAQILDKLYHGKEEEVSSNELTHFFIDLVLPSLGTVLGQDDKVQLICRVLYQFWGWHLGEDAFIDKCLNLVETLVRGTALLAGHQLKAEDVQLLNDVAKALKYTRHTLKYSKVAVDIFAGMIDGNDTALQNAYDLAVATSESALRDMLYALPLDNLFNIDINPRDLALFVLDRGHQQDSLGLFKSAVYASIYALGKTEVLNEESVSDARYAAQLFFASTGIKTLTEKYNQGRLEFDDVVKQCMNHIIILSSLYTSKNYNNSLKDKDSQPVDSKTNLPEESEFEASQIPDGTTLEQNDDLEASPEDEGLILGHEAQPEIEEHAPPLTEEEIQQLKDDTADKFIVEPQREPINVVFDIEEIAEKIIEADTTDPASLSELLPLPLRPEHVQALLEVQRAFEGDYATEGYLGVFSSTLHNQSMGLLDIVGNAQLQNDDAINLGSVRATNHVDYHASDQAINLGSISGKNLDFEGTDSQALNDGTINAKETASLSSRAKVTLGESGDVRSKRVNLNSKAIHKNGSIQAGLVKTAGFDSERPELISWSSGNDRIFALILNPSQELEHQPESFNGAQMVDLDLSTAHVEDDQVLNISSEFSNLVQVHLPYQEREIPVESLPNLSPSATLIIDAPGATLTANQSDDLIYNGKLHFKGFAFVHSGTNKLLEGHFDVVNFEGQGGDTNLELTDGGAIQAEVFKNQGKLHSDGILHWNVDSFTNDAQVKEFLQQFIHSKQTNVIDNYQATSVIPDSGTISAQGHYGYIDQLNMTGGTLISGLSGNYLHVNNAKLCALFTTEGQYTRGVIEDVGKSWFALPIANNAQVGSTGQSVLLGTGLISLEGATLWGDQGEHYHFNEGIQENNNSRTFVIEEAREHRRGRNREVTVPHTVSQVTASNYISSDEGMISLAAANGNINLTNTVFSTPHDLTLVARNKIYIGGEEVTTTQHSNVKEHGLLKSKKTVVDTTFTEIQSSYLFVGGNLIASCYEFELSGVQGVIGGADITAWTTTLSGQEENYQSSMVTEEFSITPPGNNLVSLLNGHNGKAIFSTLIQNCGWDQSELDALLNAESVAEMPAPMLNTAMNIWNMTAFVARACNEYYDGPPGEFVGTITDQLGLTKLTSDGNRIPNAKVRFNWSKTKEQSWDSHMVASNLYVGGTFKVSGGKLIVADGSKIDAKTLVLSLAQGIEMTKGIDSHRFTSSTNRASGGFNVFNPKDVDVAVGRETHTEQTNIANLASLNARDYAHVVAGESISGDGQLTAPDGIVEAPEIDLTSAQSTHTERSSSTNVNVGTNIGSLETMVENGQLGASHHQSKLDISITEQPASIDIGKGTLRTNQVNLNNGSVIDVGTFERLDGAQGLPEVTGNSGIDSTVAATNGFSAQLASKASEPGGQLDHSRDNHVTEHRPSVYASNVTDGDLPGINSNREQETEVLVDSHTGFSVAGFIPNTQKYKKQAADIQQAAQRLENSVSSAIESGSKALHFMFGGNRHSETDASQLQKESLPQISATGTAEPLLEIELSTQQDNATLTQVNDVAGDDALLPVEGEQTPEALIQSNDQITPLAGLEALQRIPNAQFYLAQLSTEEIYQLARMIENHQEGVLEMPFDGDQQSKQRPGLVLKVFFEIMNFIIPAAEASPLFVAQASAMGLMAGPVAGSAMSPVDHAAIVAWQSSQMAHAEQEPNYLPGFPSHQEPRADEQGGYRPYDGPEYDQYGFPIHESPYDDGRLEFPISEDPGPTRYENPLAIMDYEQGLYYSYNHNDETNGPDYVANPKHVPPLTPGASIDPFHNNPEKAESMLHEAIEKNYNTGGKQFYYPLRDENDKFHVFVYQPTHNDGSEYHGYLYQSDNIHPDIKDISKKWREQGLINNKELGAINRNKCPHWKPGQRPRFTR